MTSWSNEDLRKLCDVKNHKIKYDGYDFRWYHRIKGNAWDIHSVTIYESYQRAYSELCFWISRWSKELSDRIEEENRKHLKDMYQELKLVEDLIKIQNSNRKTSMKIKMIRNLIPDASVTYMADLLKVSRQAIHKHTKND